MSCTRPVGAFGALCCGGGGGCAAPQAGQPPGVGGNYGSACVVGTPCSGIATCDPGWPSAEAPPARPLPCYAPPGVPNNASGTPGSCGAGGGTGNTGAFPFGYNAGASACRAGRGPCSGAANCCHDAGISGCASDDPQDCGDLYPAVATYSPDIRKGPRAEDYRLFSGAAPFYYTHACWDEDAGTVVAPWSAGTGPCRLSSGYEMPSYMAPAVAGVPNGQPPDVACRVEFGPEFDAMNSAIAGALGASGDNWGADQKDLGNYDYYVSGAGTRGCAPGYRCLVCARTRALGTTAAAGADPAGCCISGAASPSYLSCPSGCAATADAFPSPDACPGCVPTVQSYVTSGGAGGGPTYDDPRSRLWISQYCDPTGSSWSAGGGWNNTDRVTWCRDQCVAMSQHCALDSGNCPNADTVNCDAFFLAPFPGASSAVAAAAAKAAAYDPWAPGATGYCAAALAGCADDPSLGCRAEDDPTGACACYTPAKMTLLGSPLAVCFDTGCSSTGYIPSAQLVAKGGSGCPSEYICPNININPGSEHHNLQCTNCSSGTAPANCTGDSPGGGGSGASGASGGGVSALDWVLIAAAILVLAVVLALAAALAAGGRRKKGAAAQQAAYARAAYAQQAAYAQRAAAAQQAAYAPRAAA